MMWWTIGIVGFIVFYLACVGVVAYILGRIGAKDDAEFALLGPLGLAMCLAFVIMQHFASKGEKRREED